MPEADDYQQKAAEAEQQAELCQKSEHKEVWLKIARSWRQLAEEAQGDSVKQGSRQ
jgi:ferric-dicitrate binding protein FerR (iron transport regulator)